MFSYLDKILLLLKKKKKKSSQDFYTASYDYWSLVIDQVEID